MDDTINDTARNDAAERDQARHTLSAEETSVIFAEAGVPRSTLHDAIAESAGI